MVLLFVTVLNALILPLLVQAFQLTTTGVMKTYNGLETVIGLSSGSWATYDYAVAYTSEDENARLISDNRLKALDIQNTLNKTFEVFEDLRKDHRFYRQLRRMTEAIGKIESVYQSFLMYKTNFNRSLSAQEYARKTLADFVQKVLERDTTTEYNLQIIVDIVAPVDEVDGIPIIDIMVTELEEFGHFCISKRSQMQMIAQFLGYLNMVEVKGLQSILFAYEIQKWFGKGEFINEIRDEQRKSLERSNIVRKKLIHLLTLTSNEIYACNRAKWEHKEYKFYIELKNYYQKYIIQEADVFGKSPEECTNDCSKINNKLVTNTKLTDRGASFFPLTYTCAAVLRNCERLASEAKQWSHNPPDPKICLSDLSNSTRRYDYVKFNKYIQERECNTTLIPAGPLLLKKISYHNGQCIPCKCDCTYGNINDRSRYKISLADVKVNASTNESHYVVTGARLQVTNNIIHIQIQQGKLLQRSVVDPDTVEWVNLAVPDNAAIPLDANVREVELSDVVESVNKLVVGLGFTKKKNRIVLKVLFAEFNYTSGVLGSVDQKGKDNYYSDSTELSLKDKDRPVRDYGHWRDSKPRQFLKFQTSGLEKDGGQSTIPYIDTQNVETAQPMPLSGVGLIHKGSKDSGGILGLSLFTYNITSHLLEEFVRDQNLEHPY